MPWVVGREMYPNEARIVPRRGSEGRRGIGGADSVTERIQGWEVGDKSCVTTVAEIQNGNSLLPFCVHLIPFLPSPIKSIWLLGARRPIPARILAPRRPTNFRQNPPLRRAHDLWMKDEALEPSRLGRPQNAEQIACGHGVASVRRATGRDPANHLIDTSRLYGPARFPVHDLAEKLVGKARLQVKKRPHLQVI